MIILHTRNLLRISLYSGFGTRRVTWLGATPKPALHFGEASQSKVMLRKLLPDPVCSVTTEVQTATRITWITVDTGEKQV